MSLYASVAGNRLVSGTLTIPRWGLWCADVELADATVLPSLCSITIANMTLLGAVVRQAPFTGNRTARIVGGFGGWRRAVTARAYINPAGLPLSMVLGDIAAEVGERVSVAADSILGTYFVREASKASRVLKQLVGDAWWVDSTGVTRVGDRPSVRVTTDYLVSRYQGREGRFSIATEDLVSWQPGATFSSTLVEGVQTVSSVTVMLDAGGKLRLDVLAGSADRLVQGFNDLIDAEEAFDTFGGVWEYSVTSATSSTFDGLPTSTNFPLPPLVGIPFRPGVAGSSFIPAVGSLVLVAFANRDPRRPVVVGWDGATPSGTAIDSTGSMSVGASATSLVLAGGSHVPTIAGAESGQALCYGDTVQMFLGTALVPTPIKLMRVGSLIDLAGNPVAPVSRVTA